MDALNMASFLFNLEADKGPGYIYGAVRLCDVINGFCRFTKIERPVWEAIVWPDTVTRPVQPRIGGS